MLSNWAVNLLREKRDSHRGKNPSLLKNVPAFIVDFLRGFQESPLHSNYEVFLEMQGRKLAEQLITKYKHTPSFKEDNSYYYDWDSESLFSLAGKGPGECSSGVFDLIDVDLANAHESIQKGKLLSATILAARALLITQGQEAKNDAEALEFFNKYFIDTELVDESFRTLIENSIDSISKSEEDFSADIDEVSTFVKAVQNLYDNMDQSLRFQTATRKKTDEQNP